MKKIFLFLLSFLPLLVKTQNLSPQYNFVGKVGIGVFKESINPSSAVLVVGDSVTNKGMVIPRVADIRNVTNPVQGMMVYNISDGCLYQRTLYSWVNISKVAVTTESYVVVSNTNNKRNDAASFLTLPDGRVVCAYTRFGNTSLDSDTARIYSTYSSDEGRTWTTPFQIVADVGPGDYIPSYYMHLDTLKMIYLHGVTLSTNELRQRYSLDNGLTWSNFTVIHGNGLNKYYSPSSDRVLKLKNGEYLYTFAENVGGDLQSQTGTYITRFLKSSNFGATWTLVTNTITSPDNLSVEGGALQLDDALGTIICWYRARSGFCNISKSTDNGVTWSASVPSGLYAPNSTTSMVYDENSKSIIAVHNNYQDIQTINGIGGRTIMDVSVCYDKSGYNFKRVYQIDSASGYHFIEPTIRKIGDHWLVVYSRGEITGTYYDLKAKLIPLSTTISTGSTDKNTFNTITVERTLDGTTATGFEMYNRGLSHSSAYFTIGWQTGGPNITQGNIWVQTRNTNVAPLWYNDVASGVSGFIFNNRVTGNTAIGAGTDVMQYQNNGTVIGQLKGDGRIRVANVTSNPTLTLQEGDFIVRSDTHKPMMYLNGVWTDISGAGGGGNFLKSDGNTTLTANGVVTQAGFLYRFDEQLQLGAASSTDAIAVLQLKKTNNPTFLNMNNDDATVNGNDIRADKMRAGSHILNAGDLILGATGNTIAQYRIEANSDNGGDGYTNADHVWKGRLVTNYAERMRLTGAGTLKVAKRAGGTADILALYLSDLGETNAYLHIGNYTTSGGTAYSTGFESKSNNSGYGVHFNVITTANNEGFTIDVHNGASAIANANKLFDVQNNAGSKLSVGGDGKIIATNLASGGGTKMIVSDVNGLLSTQAISGGGTVTDFSAGDLSPLFTTTETNTTTTPNLAFALTNAGANTYFGNNTGSTAAPAFVNFKNNYAENSQVVTSGSATTVTTGVKIVYVNPASVLSSHTFTFPASPQDKQQCEYHFGGTIAAGQPVVTSLTIAGSPYQSITPVAANGGDVIIYEYDLANTIWRRIK